MASRLDLHELLCIALDSRHVYYQPPNELQLVYPAIVYSRSAIEPWHADDQKYITHDRYSIEVIDLKPDSEITQKILKLPMTSYDRPYISDGLHHDVITMYW